MVRMLFGRILQRVGSSGKLGTQGSSLLLSALLTLFIWTLSKFWMQALICPRTKYPSHSNWTASSFCPKSCDLVMLRYMLMEPKNKVKVLWGLQLLKMARLRSVGALQSALVQQRHTQKQGPSMKAFLRRVSSVIYEARAIICTNSHLLWEILIQPKTSLKYGWCHLYHACFSLLHYMHVYFVRADRRRSIFADCLAKLVFVLLLEVCTGPGQFGPGSVQF